MTLQTTLENPTMALQQAARRSSNWLRECAAPTWSTRGRTATGLFAERMSLAGEPDTSYFRTFVQARHIYSFCALGRMGWKGPWRALVGETIDTLLTRARRPDGFFVHRLSADAGQLDQRADLYDQAFVLFALGAAGRGLERHDLFTSAETLLDVVETNWSHPSGGFAEGEIVDQRIRRQNPHMHLLEAALELYEASGRTRFREFATAIADLAGDRFIDPASGALIEYFDADLSPAHGMEGMIVEPGHCFEWAWLFERLGKQGWQRGFALSNGLVAHARAYGIDWERGVAVNELLTDGSVHDATARLWPQTERIKAAVARYRRTGDEAEARDAVAAAHGLERYLDVPIAGLWRDKLRPDGSWHDELAPGSSLYHISCAYSELASVL